MAILTRLDRTVEVEVHARFEFVPLFEILALAVPVRAGFNVACQM